MKTTFRFFAHVGMSPRSVLRRLSAAFLLLAALALAGCFGGGSDSPVPYRSGEVIAFDFDDLDADGRYEPEDGDPRYLPYEFCVPARDEIVDEIGAIDATALCTEVAPGTGGCGGGEMLCVGNTKQADFRGVLQRLAAKPYIREIRPAATP